MLEYCRKKLDAYTVNTIVQKAEALRPVIEARTAWRIEATLREFPKLPPLNLWFEYPVHRFDTSGKLKGVELEDGYSKSFNKKKTNKERKADRDKSLETAFDACSVDGDVTIKDIANYLGKTERTVRSNIDANDEFYIKKGVVYKK